jgi:predicted  nucleic acid-binding Zn-ribbon protein
MKVSERMRQGAGYGEALKVRDQIRTLETEIVNIVMQRRLEAYLPSEDSIMDRGSKYNAKMKAALKKLERIKKLIEEYNKIEVA